MGVPTVTVTHGTPIEVAIMPRTARVIEPNGFYHVFSRSTNGNWVLKDDEDFCHFRKLECQAKRQFPLKLFHYALMDTHFHFVLQTPGKEELSKHIAYVKWHYTQWVRKRYGWKGPLWRERFRSLIIEDESYLAACGNYVEYNPVQAGICKEPGEYPYSSYRKYHLGEQDPLLDEYESGPVLGEEQLLEFRVKLSKFLAERRQKAN